MSNDLAHQEDGLPGGETHVGGGNQNTPAVPRDGTAKAQLENLKAMFSVALNSSEHGLAIFDSASHLVACNDLFAEMYAIPDSLTETGTPSSELAKYIPAKALENTPASEAGEPAEGGKSTYILRLRNGQSVRVIRQPLSDGGWVETHDYAADRRRQEQQIAWLARHDALTEVGNPLYFGEELENALQQLKHKAIAFTLQWVDVDNFRKINETYGQPVGYTVLKTVAERLLRTVRKSDLVARLGGDEFAVIQPGVKTQAEAELLAKRLLAAINQPVEILGQTIPVSVSIGVVVAPEHGTSSLELMKNIYLALYAAKAAGRKTLAVYNAQSMAG